MKKVFLFLLLFLISIIYTANANDSKINMEVKYIQTNLIKGNYKNWIYFNKEEALKKGFSNESIIIWKEITELTNEIIKKFKEKHINKSYSSINSDIDINKYKNLNNFLKTENLKSIKNNNKSLNFDATEICWTFWNPKPTSSAPWKNLYISWVPLSDFLISLWYHETPILWFWWGWTRPQSYESWICWNWSFRDHAIININWYIKIQDYKWFSPRWEPNPEINTYTWPYAAWPAYVYWWHDNY